MSDKIPERPNEAEYQKHYQGLEHEWRADYYYDLSEYLEARLAEAQKNEAIVRGKIASAYGYLWHVNNSGVGFQFSPEKASHMARRVLRDTLTNEQRGDAINKAAAELAEIQRNSHHE